MIGTSVLVGQTTPLYIAALKGHNEIVSYLIAHKADKNKSRTDNGNTRLYTAVKKGYNEIISCFIANKADSNKATTLYGTTPLNFAIANGHIEVVRELIALWANPFKAMFDGTTPFQLAKTFNLVKLIPLIEAALIRYNQMEVKLCFNAFMVLDEIVNRGMNPLAEWII